MPTPNSRPVCCNLRTRAHYVPGLQHVNAEYNPADYTPCFCLKTLHVVGPDDRPVSQQDCTNRRACFEALGEVWHRFFAFSQPLENYDHLPNRQ